MRPLRQRPFAFPQHQWGGARRGAGRKPKGARAGVAHDTRPDLAARYPVHVTVRVLDGLENLRSSGARHTIERALERGADRFGFRLVEYSIQSNHAHLIAEASDRRSLWRGMQGLKVRIAKALNKFWKRRGTVFSDRYHARILRTPREVRRALLYVLNNARRHGLKLLGIDPCSSGAWFSGWTIEQTLPPRSCAGVGARTWLLRLGWRRHGRIAIDEVPRSRSIRAQR
jgi:REP element-mobilizing transposase RayT